MTLTRYVASTALATVTVTGLATFTWSSAVDDSAALASAGFQAPTIQQPENAARAATTEEMRAEEALRPQDA